MGPRRLQLIRPRRRLHALVFDHPERALLGVRRLVGAGFTVHDVHTPFPVHGMAEAMGLAETRIPWATLLGAACGTTLALVLQIWTHAFDWPLAIGGKSSLALPALVPVTFELAVLLAAFATVLALAFRQRLYPRGEPAMQPHAAVTDDRFVVVVEERDGSFSWSAFRQLVAALGAERVIESWRITQ